LTEDDRKDSTKPVDSGPSRARLSGHIELDFLESESRAVETTKKKRTFRSRFVNDLGKPRFYLEILAILVVCGYTYQAYQGNWLARRAQRPYIWLTNGGLGSPRFVLNQKNIGTGQVAWDWHYTNYGRSPAYNGTYQQYIKLGDQSWLGLSEQEFRVDKWNICLVQAAAICGSQLK
jgi:hypothetical protein